MKHCSHTFWLSISSRASDPELVVSDRLESITDSLPCPERQSPDLIVLIGNAKKNDALYELFNIKRLPQHAARSAHELHLHADASSFSSRPLLIAEGGTLELVHKTVSKPKCHGVEEIMLKTTGTHAPSAFGIYSYLLRPFIDVFCFFCDDLGGFEQVACYLATWSTSVKQLSTPLRAPPRVILVTDLLGPGESEQDVRDSFVRLLISKSTSRALRIFAQVEVVSLNRDSRRGDSEAQLALKRRLMNSVDKVREAKEGRQMLFAAAYLNALFKSACQLYVRNPIEPFSFIKASRAGNPVAKDWSCHLSTFLKQAQHTKTLTSSLAPIIASAFLLDSHPPHAHAFAPKVLFRVLYKEAVGAVYEETVRAMAPDYEKSTIVRTIQNHFERFVKKMIEGQISAADLHRENLGRHRTEWRTVFSSSTCLVCLRRRPQYSLRCAHVICQNCVMVFGCTRGDPWQYYLDNCPLCADWAGLEVRVNPPTAGVGVVCIDGGGVRGLGPLYLMKRIQDKIGVPIPFQKFVQVALGISSGGLIVADLFLNGHSVEESIERFSKLSKQVFRRRGSQRVSWKTRFFMTIAKQIAGPSPFSIITEVVNLLWSYFADGIYPAKHIDAALQQAFRGRTILDTSLATSNGTLVGLPVATTDDEPACRIFTNQNGVAEDKQIDQAVQPQEGSGRIPLWEVARAASAAPFFFPPMLIRGVGLFQDAGPLQNDPLASALDIISAGTSSKMLNWILSVGTGESTGSENKPEQLRPHSVWRNGAIIRLYRLVREKMKDEDVRRPHHNDPRYHRLNVQFAGGEPRLDDLEQMPQIAHKALSDKLVEPKIDSLVRYMIASLFYFELDSLPKKYAGKFSCIGHIRCSLQRGEPWFEPFFDLLYRDSAKLWVHGTCIDAVDEASFNSYGNYEKQVEFQTEDSFTISLSDSKSPPCPISGSCPFSVKRLILKQGLTAVFGTSDHRKRKSPFNDIGESKRCRVSYRLQQRFR